jgi:Sensors of blue-light using FAD
MSFVEDSQINFASFPTDQLIELSYVSEATNDMGILGLMNLLEDAVHKNKRNGITGVLFYDNRIFGQIIEGYPQHVELIWKAISADPRHSKVQVLDINSLQKRRFSNWSMKFYGSDEISQYVPELKMGLRDTNATLPSEILTLMRSVSNQNDEANNQDPSVK